ncbi:MAG: type II secretion system F family protein [Actinobacteria bacterium]|nr:type II secretion system F family protein [Actinomycetota bacterium]
MVTLIAALLVGGGLGAFAYGLARTRAEVATTTPSAIEVDDGTVHRPGAVYRVLEPLLAASARVMGKVSPTGRVELIRNRIVYAGFEGKVSSERIFSYKAVAAVLGFLLGWAAPFGSFPPVLWGSFIAVLASFVPDLWLDSRARERQAKVALDLPEALDLLSITVEAGLGLEQAMEIVTENLDGPLGAEFTRVLREIELGVSRRDALVNLRDRTDVPELSGFVIALIQADQMGSPVADVLRVQAAQVRLKRRQRAREKAAQAPVKILFPVILFIFPAIFVVTVGPGVIEILENIVNR